MIKHIRRLTADDLSAYQKMQTGLEVDYMLDAFTRITDAPNYLYGLFVSDNLVALSGFNLFQNHYAMLGRLRTDVRYRNQGYGTEIMQFSLEKALLMENVHWIGAYTESTNKASQNVFKKIGLAPADTHYAAKADSVTDMTTPDAALWQEITDAFEQKEWLNRTYLNPSFDKHVFPFEAYYPFPVSQELFDDLPAHWRFFQNKKKSRYVILWEEYVGARYLHVVYPWHDFLKQTGLFKTVQTVLESSQEKDSSTSLWWDFSELESKTLPFSHPFILGTPWVLYGASKHKLLSDDSSESLKRAYQFLDDLEEELKDLEQITESQTKKLASLDNKLGNNDLTN
ncbi:GNAT family N-acetyltransferase [Alkalibacterium kapii]|uniref:N-acetyltransferase domain-containing protein n=1 Tax=Alkalibacterium kapii TaxID=426704 RepID=A0A511AT59_9LACT|nr:GNAT family N-acetyltransferase [Alkalibacterium kapii]GEK91380.1 hypothetical protein AKA01nite_10020 [Alkalibacterium kapii]